MTSVSAEELRARGMSARRELSSDERSVFSQRIQRRFLRSVLFFRASRIACYIASPFEVDTSIVFERCWSAGKRIYTPVVDRKSSMRFVETRPETPLVRNRFGLWEPEHGNEISAQNLNVVVTPTVAFDEKRCRIGMGGGYYDRAFRSLRNRQLWLPTKLIGFAFDCQKVEEITAKPWDIPLYRVLTENESTR